MSRNELFSNSVAGMGEVLGAPINPEEMGKSVASEYVVPKAPAKKWVPKPLEDGKMDWGLIADILRATHGLPRHGNPEDPLECLVYLMLTRKTPIKTGQKIFRKLRKVFPRWEDILSSGEGELRSTLHGGGLEDTRVDNLKGVLERIRERFGCLSLERLKKWSNAKCVEFLTSLPGVGLKTAYCVMMYSLGRKVFPADTHCIRIAKRLGVIPSVVDHREAQRLLAKLIPGEYAYTLHVTMVSHGQKVCKGQDPNCDSCAIRKFCVTYRRRQQDAWSRDSKSPTVVDLFSGAGGTSLGLQSAGYRVLAAIDNDFWACQTFRLNHPELPENRIICKDIRQLMEKHLSDILAGEHPVLVIGGPPCQGFSLIGKRARRGNGKRFIEDDRNELYREYVRLVRFLRPKFVVMENVPGLFSINKGIYRAQIHEDLSDGYTVDSIVVDSADFGVPQNRRRVLFIGVSRKEFGENRAERMLALVKDYLLQMKQKTPTLRQAISDLPELSQNDGLEVVTRPSHRGRTSNYSKRMNVSWPVIHNHVSRPLNIRDQELYALLKPGETGNDAIVKYNARHLMVYRNDIFHDKYRRLVYNKPCTTIMAHLSHDGHMYIHPDRRQNRSITVREAARAQSFPDDFIFYGPRTYQFSQVGNAVPPLLAEEIGRAIIRAVSETASGGE